MSSGPKRGKGKPFVKGQSGNPAGRPKRTWHGLDVTKIAREHSPAAMLTLVEIFQDKSVTPGVRATCAEKIIERAYGKAPQISAHIHARAKPQDLSDDQLLRIIAGEPLTSVLAEPNLIEHEPFAAPQTIDNTEAQHSSSEVRVEHAQLAAAAPAEPDDNTDRSC